ncbi:MAG: response regulator [Planctomycetes bacterium]|nr:response regulator [Planctomycetota bacterium]
MAHILVVEDDVNNARVFEAVFRRLGGFEVTVSEDVEQILALCRGGNVDLVVMDVSLVSSFYKGEKVDGLAVTRILKGEPSTASIPVLLATAHAMKGDRERFLSESGADGYISKPILDHHGLVNQVRSMIADRETSPAR